MSVDKSCVTGGRSRRGFCFLQKVLYFWVYTSPVLRVGAPAGAFCFLQKHNLIFFECVQVLCCGWTPRRAFCILQNAVLHFWVYTSPVLRVDAPTWGFLFSSKTPSYNFGCIQVLCYGWTLPQGLFCFLQKHILIFLSVYKSWVMGRRSRRGFVFSSKTPSYVFECIQVLCYGWTFPLGLSVF